jgi:hypothetical protein
MDLLGYGLTWSAFPNDFHGLRARPNVRPEPQGSLSQVQVFLIRRVLVLALCAASMSQTMRGCGVFPPRGIQFMRQCMEIADGAGARNRQAEGKASCLQLLGT